MVKLLVEHGADVNITVGGKTAYDLTSNVFIRKYLEGWFGLVVFRMRANY